MVELNKSTLNSISVVWIRVYVRFAECNTGAKRDFGVNSAIAFNY